MLVLGGLNDEVVSGDAIAADKSVRKESRRTHLPFALGDNDILAIAVKSNESEYYCRFFRSRNIAEVSTNLQSMGLTSEKYGSEFVRHTRQPGKPILKSSYVLDPTSETHEPRS